MTDTTSEKLEETLLMEMKYTVKISKFCLLTLICNTWRAGNSVEWTTIHTPLHTVFFQKPFGAVRNGQTQSLEKELKKGWQILWTLASIYSCTPSMVRDGWVVLGCRRLQTAGRNWLLLQPHNWLSKLWRKIPFSWSICYHPSDCTMNQ